MTRIRHNLRNEDQDGWTFSGSGQRMRLTAVKALGAIAPETPCSDCNVMWKFSRQLVGLWLMNNSINQVWWSIWWCETVIYDSWCTQPKWYKYCSKAVADTFWCWCSHPNNALNKQCLHVDPGFFLRAFWFWYMPKLQRGWSWTHMQMYRKAGVAATYIKIQV